MRSRLAGARPSGRPARHGRRVGLLPGLLGAWLAAGCAGQRPPAGFEPPGAGDPPTPGWDEGAEDPAVEVAPLTGTEHVTRSEFRSRFWEAHGVELEVRVPEPLPVLGQPCELGLVIRNYGLQPLVLPMVRRRGLWPFRSEQQAELVLDLSEDRFSMRTGRSQRSWRHVLHPREDWVVPPVSEATFLVPLPAPAREGLDLVRMHLRATLFPLAVAFAGEPESLVAVSFPEAETTWVTADARTGLEHTTLDHLAEDLLQQPDRLLAVALRLAPQDRLAVTDWLIRQLPGPDRASRAALILSLQVVTGQPLGTATARWQTWWSSEAGAQWAMQQRLARRENAPRP